MIIPMGVSSPLRACRNVDFSPLNIYEAKGAELVDDDDNRYLDFMYGFGPLILGHADKDVVKAIQQQAQKGLLYGTACALEIKLANAICATTDHLQQLRFVCSGTEAAMSAIRLARAYTNRRKIIRCRGNYHGHFDLVQNYFGTEAVTAGLAPVAQDDNILVEYNSIDEMTQAFTENTDVAAVIMEPVACNMSLVKPSLNYLKRVRQLCDEHNTVLIFDEIISGFRLCYGPVSNLLGIQPDLSCLGKVIGGGMPVGAYGGRAEIMNLLDTESVLQGGTFAANPVTMAAGLETLDKLKYRKVYDKLEVLGSLLEREVAAAFSREKINYLFTRFGSIFALIFVPAGTRIANKQDVDKQDRQAYTFLYQQMRKRGFHLTPDVEEPMYLSYANKKEDIIQFVQHLTEVLVEYNESNRIRTV